MWDLPGQGIEPVSSALTGRFLTTGPPRKSWKWFLTHRKNSERNSHTVFAFVSGRQKHSQMHPAETTSFSLVRMVSLGLFSKNLHSILTTFSFSFLLFKEESGCHFCVSVIHNRKNIYRKRSDAEGTLRTQDFCKFLKSFWKIFGLHQSINLESEPLLFRSQGSEAPDSKSEWWPWCSGWKEQGHSPSAIERW